MSAALRGNLAEVGIEPTKIRKDKLIEDNKIDFLSNVISKLTLQ